MKLLAALLSLTLLGPILDDKERIFFGKASNWYDVYVRPQSHVGVDAPFYITVTFQPYYHYGFKCESEWNALWINNFSKNIQTTAPIRYGYPLEQEYCNDIYTLRWDLHVVADKPGKHKIDVTARFEFCTNIDESPGYVCVLEERDITAYITVEK